VNQQWKATRYLTLVSRYTKAPLITDPRSSSNRKGQGPTRVMVGP